MGLIRSFIAIELPEEIRLELARLEDSLKSGGISFVKWVNPLGIHLTLKFLGNVAPAMVAKITTAMAEVAGGRTPFRLEVGRLGIFPNIRQPRLAWVGVEGEVDKLAKLQRQIDASLSLLGFPKEQRPFTPHLTLGRLRDRASTRQRQQFGELVMSVEFEAALRFNVEAISLMRSRLTPAGPVYGCVSRVELSEEVTSLG